MIKTNKKKWFIGVFYFDHRIFSNQGYFTQKSEYTAFLKKLEFLAPLDLRDHKNTKGWRAAERWP